MSNGWKLAFWIVAATLAVVEAVRGRVWDSPRVPDLFAVGFAAFVVPFAWDAGSAL